MVAMAGEVADGVRLHPTLGTHETIAAQLLERCAGRVDRIEFSMPVTTPDDAARYREILAALQA